MWAESQGVGVLIEADDFRQLLTPFQVPQKTPTHASCSDHFATTLIDHDRCSRSGVFGRPADSKRADQ